MNSKTTPRFWKRFNALPKHIQQLAFKNYQLWLNEPFHRSLHFKRFKRELWSVRVGIHYRATGVFLDEHTFRWAWIGSHEEYNKIP
ncbi:MAG: hypothetical protein M3Y82_04295 [Verrucomicrobiota bacterium]|nr:hypothetical protein [Verrucomicrobiota bacterium]